MARVYGGSGRVKDTIEQIAALNNILAEKAANANKLRGAARKQQRLRQMVDFIVDCAGPDGNVSQADFLQAGYSAREIATLAPQAIVIASRKQRAA